MGDRRNGALAAVALLVLVYVGYRWFWFLTDDAYIAFRYAANAVSGAGLTWNPAPFRPVEGYTSFAWVVLLAGLWKLTGIAPDAAANPLGLLSGYVTLFLLYRLGARMSLPGTLAGQRGRLVGLLLFAVATNATFLTWLSSGLETSFFNCLFTWWILEASTPAGQRGPRWTLRLTLSFALVSLTRPDGLLLAAPTGLLLVLAWRRGELSLRDLIWQTAPALLVAAHLLYRRLHYGAWLPNTYFAKTGLAWPESGLRYLASFAIEQGVWVLAVMFALWVSLRLRSGALRVDAADLPIWIVCLTLAAHAAYYTLIIGGDHFEYRVYSHLIGPFFLAVLWLAARISPRPALCVGAIAWMWLAALPLPWAHELATQHLHTRRETTKLAVPLAHAFPWPLRPVVAQWDTLQRWLADHRVGLRRKELAIFPGFVAQGLTEAGVDTRDEGAAFGGGERVVIVSPCVGVLSWMLPNAAILDMHGLNDWVIARHGRGTIGSHERSMAHERTPPAGYLECFQPRFQHSCRRLIPLPTGRPLTDAEVRACEARDWLAGAGN